METTFTKCNSVVLNLDSHKRLFVVVQTFDICFNTANLNCSVFLLEEGRSFFPHKTSKWRAPFILLIKLYMVNQHLIFAVFAKTTV